MNKYFLAIVLCILGGQAVKSQVTVDSYELAMAIKEKIVDQITDQVTSSVEKGEKWVADATYFSGVLEPFKPFGIDPENPNFLNQAYELHKKIGERIEKDPNLRYGPQLKTELRNMVKAGLWNYASSCIDDDSKEIYKQVSGLYSESKQKMQDLLEAAEGISKIDPVDNDYESKVTGTLKKFGIKSDYFFLINDLDQVLSKGYDKVRDPLKAISMIADAAGSKDPVYKIEQMLELGESFGGKIPVIGELVTPIFTVGKELLNAAKRLENILENNLNQGCISPSGGTYGSVNPNKRTEFIRKFPDVERACPINQSVYSPVYSNIYFNTADKAEIFFYLNDEWFSGKKDNLHQGTDDIFAAIQWLRRNENTDKATDPGYLCETSRKEYGWGVYSREIANRIRQVKSLFLQAYQTVNYCDDASLENFFTGKMGLGWISRLFSSGDREFGWEDLKKFNAIWEKEILDQMIRNYYLSLHQPNLDRLDEIIRNLSENAPVNIYGIIAEADGQPVGGAQLQTGSDALFPSGTACQKVTTSGDGSFSYFIVLPVNSTVNKSVTASLPDGRSITGSIAVNPAKTRFYQVNLRAPEKNPDNPDQTATADSVQGVPDLSGADCGNDPLATPEWDPVNHIVICTCPDNFIWNDAKKKCEPDVRKILANSDCSNYPNTLPVWDPTANEVYCDCLPGYVWNKDNTGCVDLKNQQLANADCSGYMNTQPVWDENSKSVICDCLPGFRWNKDNTACIPEWEDVLKNFDCRAFPNTHPVWDPVARQAYCDCLPGFRWNNDFTGCIPDPASSANNLTYDCSQYPNTQPVFDPASGQFVCDCLPGFQWNRQHTGCVPERNRPKVDWNALLSFTMGFLNAAGGNNNPGIMNQGGNQGNTVRQPVFRQSNCNDQQQAGGDAPEVHTINLGQSAGSFQFDFNVYDIKDEIMISQGGALIYDSGCISGSGSLELPLTGSGTQITVRVNPNCEGNTSNTQWVFTVHCPKNH